MHWILAAAISWTVRGARLSLRGRLELSFHPGKIETVIFELTHVDPKCGVGGILSLTRGLGEPRFSGSHIRNSLARAWDPARPDLASRNEYQGPQSLRRRRIWGLETQTTPQETHAFRLVITVGFPVL